MGWGGSGSGERRRSGSMVVVKSQEVVISVLQKEE